MDLPQITNVGNLQRFTHTDPETLALQLLCCAPSGSSNSKSSIANSLIRLQKPSGAWPPFTTADEESPYTTALAVHALMTTSGNLAPISRGLRHLSKVHPREASWLCRLKFRVSDTHVRFNPARYGWPWTSTTISWVVPTAMALIAIEQAMNLKLAEEKELQRRCQLAREMLLDRSCAQGGWNAGNAVVYGVTLTAHIDTTAIALLALQPMTPDRLIERAFAWLLQKMTCRSAYSLAWSMIAVDAYKDMIPTAEQRLQTNRERLQALLIAPDQPIDACSTSLVNIALKLEEHGNPFKLAHL